MLTKKHLAEEATTLRTLYRGTMLPIHWIGVKPTQALCKQVVCPVKKRCIYRGKSVD